MISYLHLIQPQFYDPYCMSADAWRYIAHLSTSMADMG